jgi:predicted transcriptional regulator
MAQDIVLDFLLNNKDKWFSNTEIAKILKTKYRSVSESTRKLYKYNIILKDKRKERFINYNKNILVFSAK